MDDSKLDGCTNMYLDTHTLRIYIVSCDHDGISYIIHMYVSTNKILHTLFCITLHYIALHCITLNYTTVQNNIDYILQYIALHYIQFFRTIQPTQIFLGNRGPSI